MAHQLGIGRRLHRREAGEGEISARRLPCREKAVRPPALQHDALRRRGAPRRVRRGGGQALGALGPMQHPGRSPHKCVRSVPRPSLWIGKRQAAPFAIRKGCGTGASLVNCGDKRGKAHLPRGFGAAGAVRRPVD